MDKDILTEPIARNAKIAEAEKQNVYRHREMLDSA
jgi:hypothetical protein